MLTKRYMATVKNVPAIAEKIQNAVAPERFTLQYLKDLGFGGSNDRAVIPLLKDLGFLTADGAPTRRYHEYRSKADSRRVMADAIREAYGDLFTIAEHPSEKDRPQILGKFKSSHNVSDVVADRQVATFFALLKLADLDAKSSVTSHETAPAPASTSPIAPLSDAVAISAAGVSRPFGLSYTIEIHLPATTDISVYNAVFKSLKEHLLD